jgi:hypothetical protein
VKRQAVEERRVVVVQKLVKQARKGEWGAASARKEQEDAALGDRRGPMGDDGGVHGAARAQKARDSR